MTTFTNTQLSTIEQPGFLGNVDGNDVFAEPYGNKGESHIILHKGGEIHKGLVVTTQFPHAYALFLIRGHNGSVTISPEQVAKKDRKPLTTSTRREVEEAISRFNLGVQAPVAPGESTLDSAANCMDIEDVINTLDANYRLSSYLKLRGHVSYKAARLAGMYMAKKAKESMDIEGESGIDAFNYAMGQVRGEKTDNLLKNEMGLDAHTDEDMYASVRALVLYSNELNFDIQDLYDPTGKLRSDPTFKKNGVFFDEDGRKASWTSSVKLVASKDTDEAADEKYSAYSKAYPAETKALAEKVEDKDARNKLFNERKAAMLDRPSWDYKQYFESTDNKDWAMTREEWDEQQGDDSDLFTKFAPDIVELLLTIGSGTCYFDELPIRVQISAIENMRGKIPEILVAALKSVKFTRGITDRNKEATTVKGLVGGFNKAFCAMLSSSRYANHTEFMYNFAPVKHSPDNKPVSRQMTARNEKLAVKIKATRKTEHVAEGDVFDIVSDTL